MEWIKEFDERFRMEDMAREGRGVGHGLGAEVKAFITTQITKAREEEWKRCVDLLDQDHRGHALPQTCIGYGNAQSDLMNNPPTAALKTTI